MYIYIYTYVHIYVYIYNPAYILIILRICIDHTSSHPVIAPSSSHPRSPKESTARYDDPLEPTASSETMSETIRETTRNRENQ